MLRQLMVTRPKSPLLILLQFFIFFLALLEEQLFFQSLSQVVVMLNDWNIQSKKKMIRTSFSYSPTILLCNHNI